LRLRIFDVSGRLVRTLVDETGMTAGDHEVSWTGVDDTGREVAAGVYFYRLQTPDHSLTRRMTLVK
jgi:flagellar hook assembly protein FlgD